MNHRTGAPLAGFAMAEIDALGLADGDRLQLTAMALSDPFHAASPKLSREALSFRAAQDVEQLRWLMTVPWRAALQQKLNSWQDLTLADNV